MNKYSKFKSPNYALERRMDPQFNLSHNHHLLSNLEAFRTNRV